EMGRVSLSIFNLHGQRITTLVDQLMGPGAHQVDWQVAPGLPAGVYIARLQTTQGFQSLKFSLR
ncbi:MAG: T9SS type A sorting domain-containing protein, partial [Bacteroidota bacterium]